MAANTLGRAIQDFPLREELASPPANSVHSFEFAVLVGVHAQLSLNFEKGSHDHLTMRLSIIQEIN